MRIGCAVLAAGAGARFDGAASKLLARVRGKPLVQWAIDASSASRALHCSLILGSRSESVVSNVDARRCEIVVNPRWSDGIAASIACAARTHADDDALVLMLGDQPNIVADDIDRLIEASGGDAIVALRTAEVFGAPVLFPRRDFASLRALRGDEGAKRHAASHPHRLKFVQAIRSDAFADVDLRSDVVTRPVGR